ncbi:hypothetical protein ACMAUO_20645 [Gluconacetobacter sp. Hr-1-5]|uniref:hypothetical protein n=1 Tax=Gluconacetobacter sp. Hr-1-5 TaxID=3395370 RepID=UPI003B521E5B
MAPLLMTCPFDEPDNVTGPPDMNCSLLVSRVEAVKDPSTTTRPPGATTTPFGLIRKTDPVAFTLPAISDICPPVTRLSVAPEPLLN